MKDTVQTPYRGNEPFIFVSYSHIRIDDAMDIICKMQSDGYRIWYDEGIDPGSEFSDEIASQVNACEYFIALLSQEYLDSHFCIDEILFARKRKKRILLIYLEDILLPDGLEMRVGRFQAIHKYTYINQDDFYKRLYKSQGMSACQITDRSLLLDMKDDNYSGSLSTGIKMFLTDQADNNDMQYNQNNPASMLRLIFIVDTSGSMQGSWIENLNIGLQLVKTSLVKKYGVNLAIDILQFDSDIHWKTLDDLPLKVGGITRFGAALDALREFGKNVSENCSCACVFIGDGMPSDEYVDKYVLLQCDAWFRKAVISGIAISSSDILKIFNDLIVGDTDSVYFIDDKYVKSLPGVINKVAASTLETAIKFAEEEKKKSIKENYHTISTDSDSIQRITKKQENQEIEEFDFDPEEINKELGKLLGLDNEY